MLTLYNTWPAWTKLFMSEAFLETTGDVRTAVGVVMMPFIFASRNVSAYILVKFRII